jgi:hypothetical protein
MHIPQLFQDLSFPLLNPIDAIGGISSGKGYSRNTQNEKLDFTTEEQIILSKCAKVFRTFPNESMIRSNLVNLVGHHTIPGGPIVPDHTQ